MIVGLVFLFDRLLDMTRAVASASANLTVAAMVARREGEPGETRYRLRPQA